MDILTLNALGITVMAIFGLWIFHRAAQGGKKPPPHQDERQDR